MRKSIVAQGVLVLAFSVTIHAQIITTVAGSSDWGNPSDVVLDSTGNLFISDSAKAVIYRVDRFGATTIVAGTGTNGFSGDGGPATGAQLRNPQALVLDKDGVLYIADTGNHRVRRVGANGVITTIAGTGTGNFSGDGGPATAARISGPIDLAIDPAGDLYISDNGNARIRKVDRNGTITTAVGFGTRGFSGDGGPPLLARIDPGSITFGPDGALYFTDDGNTSLGSGNGRVRKVSPQGVISTVAGNGSGSYSGDGGPALSAGFRSTDGIALDSAGNLFVSEYWSSRVRKISPAGIITTYAGTGTAWYSGDEGEAIKAELRDPIGLTTDSLGNLYIADYANRRIRKVSVPPRPAISDTNSAVPSFGGKANFSSNSYIEIYGTNLSQSTRQWGTSDFRGSAAPTSLDGVSVDVNGKPAFVFFISPTQININAPDDTAVGPVSIQVRNSQGASNLGSAMRAALSPTLQTVPQLSIGGKQYVAALTPDFQFLIGRPGMIQGVAFTPGRPGSTISIYALGCGPTNPPSPAGVVATQAVPIASPFSLTIGGVTANVTFAGIVANSIGLYQFNVVIPSLPPGDHPVELIVDGVPNAQNLFLVVGE